jgi:uncharacterized protein (DUF2147 family)
MKAALKAHRDSPQEHDNFMRPLRTAAFVAALLFGISSAQAAEPTGTWLTEKGDARIHVAPCGKALCGTIVWIKDAIDPQTGRAPVDDKNPDPSKRGRKIVGMRIFSMNLDSNNVWAGPIYNSDDGRNYAGRLLMQGADALQVNGCAGALCGGELWRRVGK